MPTREKTEDGSQVVVPPEEAPEQPQLQASAGPYVRFTDTIKFAEKIITATDFRQVGFTNLPEGFVKAHWSFLNGYKVPTSLFGDGGAENEIVQRLLSDPAKEFEIVEK